MHNSFGAARLGEFHSYARQLTPTLQKADGSLQDAQQLNFFEGAVRRLYPVAEQQTKPLHNTETKRRIAEHDRSQLSPSDGDELGRFLAKSRRHENVWFIEYRGPTSQKPPLSQHVDNNPAAPVPQIR